MGNLASFLIHPAQNVKNNNPVVERMIAGTMYSFLVLASLVTNVLLGIALRRKHVAYQKAFCSLVWSVICTNCLTSLVYGIIVCPITFTVYNFYLGNITYYVYRTFIICEYVVFKGSILQALTMFLYRLTIFIAPIQNKYIFSGIRLKIIIALIWIIASIESLVQSATDCSKEFAVEKLTFNYDCKPGERDGRILFHELDAYQRTISPLLVLLANLSLFIYIRVVRRSTNKKQENKTEVVLLYQGTFICVVLSINGIIFNYFGFLFAQDSNGHSPFFLPLLLNCCFLLRAVADPLICMKFNKQIRLSLISILKRKSVSTSSFNGITTVAPKSTVFN